MTIDMLIEYLEYAREEIGGDREVRFASQPHWPFEYSITDCKVVGEEVRKEYETQIAIEEGIPEEDIDDWRKGYSFDGEDCVYLVEGRQLGYLDEVAKDEIGW